MSITTLPRPSSAFSAQPLYTPAETIAARAEMGLTLVNLQKLGIFPSFSGSETGQGGYNAAGDLITQTIDGFDLNQIWNEFQRATALVNQQRQLLIQLLTFPVTNLIDRVPQISQGDFEEASEYGEPRGIRPKGSYLSLGYDFKDYDLASRFTWKFLRDAPRNQLEAIQTMIIEADNRLMYNKIMDAMYNPTNRVADVNGTDVNVHALYNNDGTVPPKYKTNTFDGTHTHYLVAGNAVVQSGDLDDMYEHLRHHGYSSENGVRHLLFVNPAQGNVIRTFRIATGASYDFIPAQGTPAQFMPTDMLLLNGAQAPASISGLTVLGSYGFWTIVVDDMFPAGYMLGIGTGGPESLNNPVGFREHPNPAFRGLRLVKGPDPNYPLVDSFYQRSFGTGIRQRGGSVVMQVKASGTYDIPTFI
jgi:hypothetical protein